MKECKEHVWGHNLLYRVYSCNCGAFILEKPFYYSGFIVNSKNLTKVYNNIKNIPQPPTPFGSKIEEWSEEWIHELECTTGSPRAGSKSISKPSCTNGGSHSWIKYTGMQETFTHCKGCGVKK